MVSNNLGPHARQQKGSTTPKYGNLGKLSADTAVRSGCRCSVICWGNRDGMDMVDLARNRKAWRHSVHPNHFSSKVHVENPSN